MDPNSRLPVLRARPRDLAPHVLVVGDPQRAADIAQRLDHAEEVGRYREYLTFTGEYHGKRISVSSHGVGAGGACICFEELFQAGVRTVVRVGTCAGLDLEIESGEWVIPTGAIRAEGTTAELVPLGYPAIADRHIVGALETAARANGARRCFTGLVLTEATLYPGLVPVPYEMWIKAGAVAVEMEMAALLVIAGLHRRQAGGILTCDRNLGRLLKSGVNLDTSAYDPHRDTVAQGVQHMISVALEAVAGMASGEERVKSSE